MPRAGTSVAVETALGELAVPDHLTQQLHEEGFDELPVTVEDGSAAGPLPRRHGDPFDCMLLAQAARRRLVVVTADRRFAAYDVLTLSWLEVLPPTS